jgi:hypothetical protein
MNSAQPSIVVSLLRDSQGDEKLGFWDFFIATDISDDIPVAP